MVFWYRPQPAESMDTLLIKSIADQKAKELAKNIWAVSPWKDIATLENNNVGLVGENFIQSICERLGIPSSIDGSKTKAVGGGAGDGTIYGENGRDQDRSGWYWEVNDLPARAWREALVSQIHDFHRYCSALLLHNNIQELHRRSLQIRQQVSPRLYN